MNKFHSTVFLLTTLAVLLTLALGGCGGGFVPPSDKKLEENFRAHEADFQKLTAMLKEDANVQTVDQAGAYSFEGTRQKIQLPPPRLDEYRRLLRQINVNTVSRTKDNKDFTFLAWTGGVQFDQNKYYVYLETPPSPLVDSLDDTGKLPSVDSNTIGYKKLGGNWYLHYWHD